MRMRRVLPTALAAGLLVLCVPLASVPAQADPVPAPYSGGGHADIATADVSVTSPLLADALDDSSLTDVTVGHAKVRADSGASPRTRAESANLEADLLGGSVTRDDLSATAPPDATYDHALADPSVPGLLTTKDLYGSGQANWAGDTACVTGKPLAKATTTLTSATLGDLELPLSSIPTLTDQTLTLAKVGAGTTTTTTELVAHGSTNDVRTTTTAHLATTELLGGLVKLDVANPTLVARSDGSAGTTSYNDPVVSLTADTDADGTDDVTIPDVKADSGTSLPLTVPVIDDPLAGTLTATVDLTVNDDSPTISGANASVELPAVVSVEVTLSATGLISGLLGDDVASVSMDLLPLSASATAPAGGVECQLAPPVITAPADGSATFERRPTITGTGVPGATVHVYLDGSPTAADVTANGSGDWAYTPSSALSFGQHNVVATQSLDGLTSDQSNHPAFRVVERPDITAPTDGSSSYDLKPPIGGTGQPGGTIKVVVDGATLGTTTVDQKGDWQLTPTDNLSCGRHTAGAEQTFAGLDATTQTVSFKALCVDLTGGGGSGGDGTQTGSGSSLGGGASTGALPGTGAPAGAQWLAVLGAAVTAAGVALTRKGLVR